MKIVVLVKEVPDTYVERALDQETGLAVRRPDAAVLDEINERAIEVAVAHAENTPDTEVVLLTMGPESAAGTVQKGLAMGADSAVHVVGGLLVGADVGLTAEALAAALRRIGFDLVIAGDASTDGAGGVLPAMLAELLDVPQATALSQLEIGERELTGTRVSDEGTMSVSARLPAVVSVTEALPEGRLPTFRGIMTAKKKPVQVIDADDLDIQADDPQTARSIMLAIERGPARSAGVVVIDEGDGGRRLADFLRRNRLV